MTRIFPFIPKSAAKLEPGDFWCIPLSDALNACGIVLQRMPGGMPGAHTAFLAGLLDWCGSGPPSVSEISTARIVEQGVVHVLAVQSTGGAILGHVDLATTEIEPLINYHTGNICRGFTAIRPWAPSDGQDVPPLGWWGYDVLAAKARKRFLLPAPN